MGRASSLGFVVVLAAWLLVSVPVPSCAAGEEAVGVIRSINATVTGLRFFDAGREPPPLAQRRPDDRFLHHPAPWIYWELSLAHPPPGRRAWFTIEEVWHSPGGGVAHRGSRVFTLESHWKGSTWWASARLIEGRTVAVDVPRLEVFRCRGMTGEWGPCATTTETRLEYWPTGAWKVELLVDKQPIAAGRFTTLTRKVLDDEIRRWLADRSSPTHRVAPLGGQVRSLRLYVDDSVGSSGRQHTRVFARSVPRIGWELDVAHAAPGRWVPVTLEARWLQTGPAAERVVGRRVVQVGVAADWKNTTFNDDSGPGSSRGWPAGTYRLDLCVDGAKVASEPFEIR